ncbi:hypothetical protein EYZ11_002930 [Aspergillus tanneri]|nr:hypothetical protein EYZ11_002930 [Aspergillus tanneri]
MDSTPSILRSSCDNCTAAKVKCSQGRPGCARCARHGVTCAYSISRKATRNGMTSRKNKPRSQSALSTVPSVEPPAEPPSNMTPALPVDASQLPPTPSLTWDPHFATFSFGETPAILPNGSPPAGSPPMPPFHAASGVPWSLFAKGTTPNFPLSQLMETPTPAMEMITDPPTDSSNGSKPREGDNCCSESVDIMVLLQFKAIHEMRSNAIARGRSEETSSLPFDHILTTCRSACQRLLELMQCDCATKGHMALMHSSIISAILYWFNCAAQSEGPRPADFLHSYSPPARACVSAAPSVSGPPTTMGLYQLEEEDRVAIRQTLILGKLRRVATAIDRLEELGTGTGSRSPNIHKGLATWLRTEMQQVTSALRVDARVEEW